MLKHDDDGFLTGDPIDLTRAIDIWGEIQSDVAAIRQMLAAPNSAKAERSGQRADPTARRQAQAPATRGAVIPAASRFGSNRARQQSSDPTVKAFNEIAQPRARNTPAGGRVAVARPDTPAVRPASKRDASGRFVAGAGRNAANGAGGENNPDKKPKDPDEQSAITGLIKRLGNVASGTAGGIEEADPTVKAFNEIAQPLSQGYSMIKSLGGDKSEKKKERWYRRIFGELRLFRKEETAFSKATTKTLKEIEKKPDDGGGGGGGGFFGGLFAKGGLMGGAAALMKKIPLIGGLIASAGNLFDIFSSESDDSLTRGEKDQKTGKGVGGLAGTLGGMWAGAKLGAMVGALGGPIGIAIGGVVGGAAGMFFGEKAGKVVGETVGGWVADLREADIPGKIVAAWDETTDDIRSMWDTAMNNLSKTWASIRGAADKALDWTKEKGEQANTWIEEKTGVNVKETAGKAVETAKDAGNAANSYVKEKTGVDVKESAGKTVDKAKEGVSWLGEKASSAKNWISDKATGAFNSTAEKLVPGYRHKESFEGIAGGAGLAKNGSYTSAEAERIRELKTSGANTGANLAGGMPADIQQKIRASSEAHGLDPEMMMSIAAMESGGNANAISSTGASGIYQFTGRTATSVGIKDRFDADQNIEGGMKLTRQNAAMLQKRGLPVTPENVYMMHQLGPAAMEVISGAQSGKKVSELSKGAQSGMGLNYGSSSSTAAEYLAKNKAALDSRYQTAVASSAAGVQTVAPPTQVAAAVPSPVTSPVASPVLMAAAPAQTASVPAVNPPSIPASPAVAEAPKVSVPLGGGGNGRPTQVNVSAPDAGQDVRDRRIAHIVTGGLSS